MVMASASASSSSSSGIIRGLLPAATIVRTRIAAAVARPRGWRTRPLVPRRSAWPLAAGARRCFGEGRARHRPNDEDDVRMVAAAADGSLVMGRGGQLPWDLPEDRGHFFHLTHGHVLVLGRRSYQELGHALPGRTTVVVARTLGSLPDAHVTPSLAEALALARKLKRESHAPGVVTWIGGGHDLYAEAMRMGPGTPSRCGLLYLTRVHMPDVEGDTFFPSSWRAHFSRLLWSCPSSHHPCTYEIYARRQPQQEQQELEPGGDSGGRGLTV